MKPRSPWSRLTLVLLVIAVLSYTQPVSSNLSPGYELNARALSETFNPAMLPPAVFTVTKTADTNDGVCNADCSLREAIRAANADVTANEAIITLQPALTYNLTLTNATQENAAATGDLDIIATNHAVTIKGGGSSGPNATTISAAGLNGGASHDRVFHIVSGLQTVTFTDLNIANGRAIDDGTNAASTVSASQSTPGTGGAILSNGGSVTLNNVVVQQCQALGRGDSVINDHTTLDARGGGLASPTASGTVIITNSRFTSNTAAGGNGGNFNNGAGSNAQGGSIYFGGGTLEISGSRIDNTTASGGDGGNQDQNGQTNGGFGGMAQGGGVWIGGGGANITNTTFESTIALGGKSGTGGNGANPGGDAGGGSIYSLGNTTVNNSTFNLAKANGGQGGNAFGTMCFGAHNAGDGGGARGGAILADGGTMIINTATFANNSAIGGHGGNGGQTNGGLNCGMHGAGGLAHGGAITNNNAATLNIKHATISLNKAQAGNTGVNQGGANKPPRPVAEGAGGGIRVGPASVTLENTIIAGNTAANGAGDASGAPTPGPNVDGTVTSNGHNLLSVATDAVGFSGAGDKTGANPMLAALADNGGPTQTMKLSAGSAAIDAGVAAGATLDQRGLARTIDDPGVANAATSDGTDIGAFEGASACTLLCPANITAPNDAGKCGAIVTYKTPALPGCGKVTCNPPSGSFFPVGTTVVSCTSANGPTCTFKVTVNDTEKPVITLKNKVMTLWPPNHQYETVNVSDLVASVSDNCDAGLGLSSVSISRVTSDEVEDANGNGDGHTLKDIVIASNCKSVKLRAERMGSGNGRVYNIAVRVKDAAGNMATATARVTVRKSQNGADAVDDGPHYTVTGLCRLIIPAAVVSVFR